jgi:hypothetical protein
VRFIQYQLNKWKELESACIVEGEKDFDNPWKLEYPATTSPMGAKKRKSDYDYCFAGKQAVIHEDNNESGEDHVRQVASPVFRARR